MNECPCFHPLSYGDCCTQEWLWHNSLGEPEMWFDALLSFRKEFVQIANFANDKPGISMVFFLFVCFFQGTAAFSDARQVRRREKKRSDVSNLHKFTLSGRRGGAGWTRWPHGLPTHVTVKINGRHQRQLPPQETFHIHLYCACVDQWRATTL